MSSTTKLTISPWEVEVEAQQTGSGGVEGVYLRFDGVVAGDLIFCYVDEAIALRDALTAELEYLGYGEKKLMSKVGTVSVKVVPDTSDFGELLLQAVRAEVQSLAESAMDYAVKPAAQQALANLAGAAELARS